MSIKMNTYQHFHDREWGLSGSQAIYFVETFLETLMLRALQEKTRDIYWIDGVHNDYGSVTVMALVEGIVGVTSLDVDKSRFDELDKILKKKHEELIAKAALESACEICETPFSTYEFKQYLPIRMCSNYCKSALGCQEKLREYLKSNINDFVQINPKHRDIKIECKERDNGIIYGDYYRECCGKWDAGLLSVEVPNLVKNMCPTNSLKSTDTTLKMVRYDIEKDENKLI